MKHNVGYHDMIGVDIQRPIWRSDVARSAQQHDVTGGRELHTRAALYSIYCFHLGSDSRPFINKECNHQLDYNKCSVLYSQNSVAVAQ